MGQDCTVECETLDSKIRATALWDTQATESLTSEMSTPFKKLHSPFSIFAKIPQAREGLSQRPLKKQGDPAGELMIPYRESLSVTTELPSGQGADEAVFHNEVQMIFVLSELKKSTCVLQYQSFNIVFLANFSLLIQVFTALSITCF